MIRIAISVLLGLSIGISGGCVKHISPYKPKIRNYKPDKYAPLVDRREEGSLFNDSADTLFTYRRASRVGDLIAVSIAEKSAASRDATTELSRSSESSMSIASLAGLMAAIKKAHPSVDPQALIDAVTKNDFNGAGSTTRSGSLEALVTVRIKKLLPNGDFYIEGHKVVMVNNEESHLYLSGVVRPSDVQADNTVDSGRIADAQIEYTGRGVVADKQSPGWFSRFFDWINPF